MYLMGNLPYLTVEDQAKYLLIHHYLDYLCWMLFPTLSLAATLLLVTWITLSRNLQSLFIFQHMVIKVMFILKK